MSRVRMTIEQIRREAKENGIDNADKLGVAALVDLEDMGFCRDGVTRYYLFTNNKGQEAIYYKY